MNLFKRVVGSAKKKNFTRTKDRVNGGVWGVVAGVYRHRRRRSGRGW